MRNCFIGHKGFLEKNSSKMISYPRKQNTIETADATTGELESKNL